MATQPKSLQDCFQAGADARVNGLKRSDNPYPVDGDERAEWDEGFKATCDLDEDDDPASDRLNDKFD